MTTAIVLAGGASSRFGSDKLAADLDGRPVLHHALDAVASVADRVIVVVGPASDEPVLPPSLASAAAIVRDARPHEGPLAGLASGLAAMATGVAHDPGHIAIVVGADMPRLVPAVLRLLVDALAADPSLGAVILEADPLSALPMAVRPVLVAPVAERLLREQRRALRGVLRDVPSAVVPAGTWRPLDPDGRTLRDIDTRGDLASR